MELQPLRARCFLHVSNDALGSRIVRVHQQGDHPSPRNQLRQQLKPLSRQLVGDKADQPVPDRVGATPEDDRDRRGRAFRG